MKTIHELSDHIIAQIAAGEVIERPAYAIKELVENAVDAQAKRISIELTDSGLAKLIVTDDGIGMSKEDTLESFKLHTTSKINNEATLSAIKSLGFRGEALASIAAMSLLSIESKTHDAIAGTKLTIHYGDVTHISSLGMPGGTRIIVEQLFSNVPARKKFLSSKKNELRKILDVVMAEAIANPDIFFSLSHEGKLLFELPASTMVERCVEFMILP